jgi:hypothetical protein
MRIDKVLFGIFVPCSATALYFGELWMLAVTLVIGLFMALAWATQGLGD